MSEYPVVKDTDPYYRESRFGIWYYLSKDDGWMGPFKSEVIARVEWRYHHGRNLPGDDIIRGLSLKNT